MHDLCTIFITIDANGNVRGTYDGCNDLVHRLDGLPVANAQQIPDSAIRISTADRALLESLAFPHQAKWNGSSLEVDSAQGRGQREAAIAIKELQNALASRPTELEAMSDAEIEALATSLGV